MLLARSGYRVLVVDRDEFPSDTLSTHMIHPPGIAALRRWGLLDRLVATRCPQITTYRYDFGFFTISGTPQPVEGLGVAYGPRRTVLDKLLVDAAVEAGAEVRERFAVDEILWEDGRVIGIKGRTRHGASVSERARVVVGADGRHSIVVAAVPNSIHKKDVETAYPKTLDLVPEFAAKVRDAKREAPFRGGPQKRCWLPSGKSERSRSAPGSARIPFWC